MLGRVGYHFSPPPCNSSLERGRRNAGVVLYLRDPANLRMGGQTVTRPAAEWRAAMDEVVRRGDPGALVAALEKEKKSSGTPPGRVKSAAVRAILDTSDGPSDAYRWARELARMGEASARDLAAMIIAALIPPMKPHKDEELERLVLRLADDEHWETRESAAGILARALSSDFEGSYAMLSRWTRHPSENARRAVAVGVKLAAKERAPGRGTRYLDLIEPLLGDRAPYVRKNLGPFAIGDALLRYYPRETLDRLTRWADEEPEEVRWNVAMVFSAAEGAKHAADALRILERLATDERRFVRRAVASALKKLAKRRPDEVIPVLRGWTDDCRRKELAEAVLNPPNRSSP